MIEVKNPARLTLAEIRKASIDQLFRFSRLNHAHDVLSDDSLKEARAGARRLHRALFSQEWVPVEQELPPDGESVLVTFSVRGRSPSERHVTMAAHYKHGPNHHGAAEWIDTETGASIFVHGEVLAWRFQPEPYDG